MRAVCIYNVGNDFDTRVGDIVAVDIESFHITQLWRDGVEIDISDPKRPEYFLPAEEILSLLKVGDEVEENYGGMYRVIV